MNITELYGIFKNSNGVSTDSRSIKGGELFFALKGENFDGNKYAFDALKAGAAWAVVDKDSIDFSGKINEIEENFKDRIIEVEDSLKALQELSRWHRSVSFVNGKPLTVIALTGTNGKTTTKELLRSVLSTKYEVLATEGNLNNQIGVPLTLLKIKPSTELAIIEVGASHIGDIAELVSIALPNLGLITNVGKAHLEGFGSFEGVMATKGELYDYLQRTADKVFLNVDNEYLRSMAETRPDLEIIPYGVKYNQVAYVGTMGERPDTKNEEALFLTMKLADGQTLDTHLVGKYNAENIMAALAVGKYFDVPLNDALTAISHYIPSNNRSQLIQTTSNSIVVDAYNANPSSMEAALINFLSLNAPFKVAMLGEMRELGNDSYNEHLYLIKKALFLGLDMVYFVGEEFIKVISDLDKDSWKSLPLDKKSEFKVFKTSEETVDYLKDHPISGATILIKGSRGIRMEKCIAAL